MESHSNAYFEVGDTIILEKSASVPSAEVIDIIFESGELHYKLEWSTGNRNTKPVSEMDSKAENKTPRF